MCTYTSARGSTFRNITKTWHLAISEQTHISFLILIRTIILAAGQHLTLVMSLTLLTFWSTILLGFLISITHAGNWNTGVQTLVTERLDPIVSPNAVAGHMHSVVGGSAFAAAYNYQDQLKSTCTSFPISVDRSNYWHPKLYWINNNGTSFTPLAQGNRVYYFREKSSPNDHVQPFPEGLRMIVGDPSSKIANNLSFSFLCRTSSVFDGPGDIWSSDFNFERDCPNDLLVSF